MRRRLVFWKDAVLTGMAQIVKLAGALTLFVGGSVVVLAGVVLTYAGVAWLVAGGLALLFAVYAEGSYRAWDAADNARNAALLKLGQGTPREALMVRIAGYQDELELIQREAPDTTVTVSQTHDWNAYRVAYNDLAVRVTADLRLHAPGFRAFWDSEPPGVDPASHPPADIGLPLFTKHGLNNLEHILSQLKAGMDQP